MIRVSRIGHATFETPDLERQIDYYTQVNGLALIGRGRDRAFLATRIGQLVVALEQGPQARCTGLSFEVPPDCGPDEVQRVLSREGIASDLRNDSVPGVRQVLTFHDPKGTSIGLFSQWDYPGHNHQV